MKPTHHLKSCLAAAGLLTATGLAYGQAQVITWTAATGNLFEAANWDRNAIPGVGDIVLINNAGTATIAADAGTHDLAAIRMGDIQDGTESGHIVMNGGTLNIGGTEGDPKCVIGFSATLSTFIMNGGTIYFDGPDRFPGSRGDDGLNGLDWEVGEKGLGRFEMHNDAQFFGGDDLKVGANAAGHGSVLIDGHAHLAVGSGISVSEGGPTSEPQVLTIGGNAVVDSGNSLGAGNPGGSTDEGYLTMAAANDSTGQLVVQDNAVINYRRLSAREGTSIMIVKDHAQMHIFDVLAGKGALGAAPSVDRPAETGPNSAYGSKATSDVTLVLQDDAVMTVNSDPASGPTKGLAISGPRDGSDAAGKAVMTVRDRAAFRVEQDLALGTGLADSSDGTLTVIGPAASVTVGGNLALAVDLEGTATPGKGTINPVITGATHAVINVAGTAFLANGTLKVKLDGYTPVGGELYIIIQGGNRSGKFLATDFTEASLGAGLSWVVDYTASSVLLRVAKASDATRAWRLVAITGQQGDDTPGNQGGFLYPDHTLFEVNQTSGAITKLLQVTFVNDSQSIGYDPADGLLYHTAGSESYSNNPQRNGHDQGGPDIAGVGYQDSQYMETVNLTTGVMTGVFNSDPCPNPDSELPCFGLPAPRPSWVRPVDRRDSTQVDGSFRERGENEYHASRGMAWSIAKKLFYISDENGIFKLTPGGDSTFLAQVTFPSDSKSDVAKGVAFVTVDHENRLLVGHRDAGSIIEIHPETGAVLSELPLTYPAGGGDPTDSFGGLVGLAQHPVTGVLYGVRKTSDNFGRELVTINPATGATTLVGNMGMHIADITFVPVAGAEPATVSAKLDGTDIVITYTGTLTAADTITGTFSPVAGTSPLRVPIGSAAAAKFYRASN